MSSSLSLSLLRIGFAIPLLWSGSVFAQAAAGDNGSKIYYVCPYNRDRPEDLYLMTASPEFLRRILKQRVADPDLKNYHHKQVPEENGVPEVERLTGCVHLDDQMTDQDVKALVAYDAGYNSGYGRLVDGHFPRPGGIGKFSGDIIRLEDATPIVNAKYDDVKNDKQGNSFEATLEAQFGSRPPNTRDPKWAESYIKGVLDGNRRRWDENRQSEPAPVPVARVTESARHVDESYNRADDGDCAKVRNYLQDHTHAPYPKTANKPSCDLVRQCMGDKLSDLFGNTCKSSCNLSGCKESYESFCKNKNFPNLCISGVSTPDSSSANYSAAQVATFKAEAIAAADAARNLSKVVSAMPEAANFKSCFIYKTQKPAHVSAKPSAIVQDDGSTSTHIHGDKPCTGVETFDTLERVLAAYASGTPADALDAAAVVSMDMNFKQLLIKNANDEDNAVLTKLGAGDNPNALAAYKKFMEAVKVLNDSSFTSYVKDTNGVTPNSRSASASLNARNDNINPDDIITSLQARANADGNTSGSCLIRRHLTDPSNQKAYLDTLIRDANFANSGVMEKFLNSDVCRGKAPARSKTTGNTK